MIIILILRIIKSFNFGVYEGFVFDYVLLFKVVSVCLVLLILSLFVVELIFNL